MNIVLSLILTVVVCLCIPADSEAKADAFAHLNEDMNKALVKKSKNGWQCAGVTCPKKFTASCKVTKVLKPSDKLDHDLLIICMDKDDKVRCGITRSRKGQIQEVLDMDEDGNTTYEQKEVITTNDGTKIPRCPRK
ncbi:uncharacterized protein LOC128259781 isoform X2 [Drosophila gunungcola]|uniref:uncharacterized protein LOC128259781 isoform X2 n=1 Tax=Drosophila gunungcola TaxID=103775 RepID=UPI0022E1E565|nr:uncharacterized protein LOC128259781 isoform X2 [Drosophila gunungcola]